MASFDLAEHAGYSPPITAMASGNVTIKVIGFAGDSRKAAAFSSPGRLIPGRFGLQQLA
jgi:hypothetical protein